MVEIALQLAAGRGNTPGILSGIAIVLGIALTLFVLGLTLHFLFHRFTQTRARQQERKPHRPGRVGRISKQQGP